MGSPGCVPRRPSQCDQAVMCCKPDVDAKCDWIFELVALRLWDCILNCIFDAYAVKFRDPVDVAIIVSLA